MITNLNKSGTKKLGMVEIDRLLQQKKTIHYLVFSSLPIPFKLVYLN